MPAPLPPDLHSGAACPEADPLPAALAAEGRLWCHRNPAKAFRKHRTEADPKASQP